MPFSGGVYQLPTTSQELVALAKDCKGQFEQRNTRMRLEQQYYELKQGVTEEGLTITLPTPATLVNTATAMIASKPPRINVAARRQEDDDLAQRIEDFLDWWRRTAERQYRKGVRNPLVYDEAQYIVLRGWVCGRLLLNPYDQEFPWSYTLLDPMHVYPMLGGDQVLYVAHSYRPTVSDVMAEWPEAEEFFATKKPYEPVEYTALYTDHELAVVVDNVVIKEPEAHDYGFNPIVIGLAAGSAYRATDQGGQDWTKYFGTGILGTAKETIDQRQKLALMYHFRLSKDADPPVVLKSDGTEQAQLDTRARGRTVIGLDENLEVLKIGPQGSDVAPLMEFFQLEQDRATLGPAVWADGAKFASGFQESIAAGTARNALWPFVRGLEGYYDTLFHNVLELYKRFQPQSQPVNYVAMDQQTGRRTAWNSLVSTELLEADVVVECEFKSVTPENESAKAQIGAQAAQLHILDLDTVRSKYYDVERPQSTQERVLADLVMQDPMLVQALSIAAAMRSGNPYLVPIMMQLMQGAGPPGTQAGATEDPPPASLQGPNETGPDEMGANAGLEPGTAGLGGPVSSNTLNQARLPGT
jgi:hypothetical protein